MTTPTPADNLRDRIAEALIDWAYRGDQKYAALRRDETVRANAYSRADAVLAVLPATAARQVPGTPPTDTTTVDRRARYAAAIRDNDGWVLDGGQHMLDAVMAVADTEQATLLAEVDRLRTRVAELESALLSQQREDREEAARLHAAADRAAVLREGADELGRMDYDVDASDYGYDSYRDAWSGGVIDGAGELRRLADEAQQPATATTEEPQ